MGLFNQLGHAGDWTSPAKYLEAKGFLYGLLASAVGYGLARRLMALSRIGVAMLGMAVVFALVGLLTLLWIAVVGFPPIFTLEGAWLWPLGIVPLILSLVSFKRWRRMKELTGSPVGG